MALILIITRDVGELDRDLRGCHNARHAGDRLGAPDASALKHGPASPSAQCDDRHCAVVVARPRWGNNRRQEGVMYSARILKAASTCGLVFAICGCVALFSLSAAYMNVAG